VRSLPLLFLLLALEGITSGALGAQRPDPIAVVVNPANPLSDIAVEDVRHLYLGVRTAFPNGQPVLLFEASPVAKQFYAAALGMDPAQVKRHWIGMVFSGDPAVPPLRVETLREVKRRVARYPGAVSFLPAALADTSVKILRIHGALPGDRDYPLR
jgi:hypothetical protein